MGPISPDHGTKTKLHEGMDTDESEPNIRRRKLVAHPSRIGIKIFLAENRAFPLEPIDASDQLMSKHYELLKRQ